MPVDSEGREPGEAGYNRPDAETRDDDRGKGGRSAGRPGAKPAGGSWLKEHRDLLIIVLTMLGVLIGWFSLKRSGSSQGGGAGAGVPTSGTGLGTPGQPDPNASGAVDGFGANLSHMSDILDQLQANLGGSADSSTPSSTPKAFDFTSMNHSWANEPASAPARFLTGTAAKGLHYVRNRATGAIYQVNPNGRFFHLGASQYAALGKPKFTEYGHAPPKKKPVKPPAFRRGPAKK